MSQGVYFCTGNHNFKVDTFDLIAEKILINSNSWIGAMAKVGLSVTIEKETFVKFGEIVTKNRIS